jgi:hypothetical protein
VSKKQNEVRKRDGNVRKEWTMMAVNEAKPSPYARARVGVRNRGEYALYFSRSKPPLVKIACGSYTLPVLSKAERAEIGKYLAYHVLVSRSG